MSQKSKIYKVNWYKLDYKDDENKVPVINPMVFLNKPKKFLTSGDVPAMEHPIEILAFSNKQADRVLTPWYLANSVKNTLEKGYFILPISLDTKSPKEFKASSLPFKQIKEEIIPTIKDIYEDTVHKEKLRQFRHLKNIIIPKLKDNMAKYKLEGFFLMEGDVIIEPSWNSIKKQIDSVDKPIWLGYKKILRAKSKPLGIDYVVGNFLLYFPRSSIPFLIKAVENQKRDIYSDRFFTQMVQKGDMIIPREKNRQYPAESYYGFTKSIADEIAHDSSVKGGVRSGIQREPLPKFPIMEGKFTEPKKFIESKRKMTDLLSVKEVYLDPKTKKTRVKKGGDELIEKGKTKFGTKIRLSKAFLKKEKKSK